MPRANDVLIVTLNHRHVNWGERPTTQRNPFEKYIPIPIADARRLDLRKTCPDYHVQGTDFSIFAGGSQGANHEYGKNFESRGKLTLLGHFLSDQLHATAGDRVQIFWVTDTEVTISIVPHENNTL